MTTISLVVPAYNESARIGESLRVIDEAFSKRDDLDTEIIIVNDGSHDDTLDVLKDVVPSLLCQTLVITHDVNQGLGGALRTGFARTRGEIVVAVDADLSYGLKDIFAIIDKSIETGVHVVIASPYMPGGRSVAVPPQLEKRSRTANKILGSVSIHDLYTLTGMVRAYNGDHIRALSLKAVDIDINSEIIYKTELLRGSIVEVPATLDWSTMAERASRSRLGSKRSRWNTAKSLVNAFLFRPFLFPLLPLPVLLAAAAVLFFYPGGLTGIVLAMSAVLFSAILVLFSLLMLQLKRYFEETYSAIARVVRPTDHPTHGRIVYDSRNAE